MFKWYYYSSRRTFTVQYASSRNLNNFVLYVCLPFIRILKYMELEFRFLFCMDVKHVASPEEQNIL